jgi:hypothetical protein
MGCRGGRRVRPLLPTRGDKGRRPTRACRREYMMQRFNLGVVVYDERRRHDMILLSASALFEFENQQSCIERCKRALCII